MYFVNKELRCQKSLHFSFNFLDKNRIKAWNFEWKKIPEKGKLHIEDKYSFIFLLLISSTDTM